MYLQRLTLPRSLTTALSRRRAVLSFLVLAVLQAGALTDHVSAATPALTITTVDPLSYQQGNVGDTFFREIHVYNGGTAVASAIVIEEIDGSSVQVVGVTSPPLAIFVPAFGPGLPATIVVFDGLAVGATTVIVTQVTILDCTAGDSGQSLLTVWECSTCAPAPPPTAANVVVTGTPVLSIDLPKAAGECWGDGERRDVVLSITNNGTGPAKNVVLDVSSAYGSHSTFVPGSFLPFGSALTTPPVPGQTSCPGATIGSAQFSAPQVGIAVGETHTKEWDADSCCPQDDAFNQDLQTSWWDWTISYTNQCDPTGPLFQSYTYTPTSATGGWTAGMDQWVHGPTSLKGFTDPLGSSTVHFVNESIGLWPGDDTKQLEFEVTLDPGLSFVPGSLHIRSASGEAIWEPTSLSAVDDCVGLSTVTATFSEFVDSTTVPPPDCQFAAGDWPGTVGTCDWRDWFIGSELILEVQACDCQGFDPPPSSVVTQRVRYLSSQNCTGGDCWLPLSEVTHPITISCPGCRRQGIHSLDYTIERTTLGLLDVLPEDGVADLPETPRINKTARAMVGDELVGTLSTEVRITSDYNPWCYGPLDPDCPVPGSLAGFPYELKHGYWESTITNGANLTLVETTVDVEDYTYDTVLDVYELAGSFTFTIPAADATVTQGANGTLFRHDFSIDRIQNDYTVSNVVPPTYDVTTFMRFDHLDKLTFASTYKLTGNPGLGGPLESYVTNHIYLGVKAEPPCDPITCDPSGEPFICNSIELPPCNDDVQYHCPPHYGGLFHQFGYAAGPSYYVPPTFDVCDQKVQLRHHFLVGVNDRYRNYFCGEYRNFGHLAEVTLAAQQGYTILDTTFTNYSRTAGTNDSTSENLPSYSPVPPVLLDGVSVFSGDPLDADPDDNFLYLADESFNLELTATVEPSCKLSPGTYTVDATATYDVSDEISCANPTAEDRIDTPVTVAFRKPVLVTQAAPPTVDGLDSQVCWDLLVDNVTADADARYTWIGVDTLPPGVTITSVDLPSVGNLVYGLEDLGVDRLTQRSARICADYVCNQDLDPITFSAFTGWDCQGYPASVADYGPCIAEETELTVQPRPAGLQAELISEPALPLGLCQSRTYEIYVKSTKEAVVNDIIVSFTGQGIEYAGGAEIEYPAGNTTPIQTALLPPWNVTNILGFGLPGDAVAPGLSDFIIRFDLKGTCDASPGSSILFEVSGESHCGAPLPTPPMLSLPFAVAGFPATPTTAITFQPADFAACEDTSTVYVRIDNTDGQLALGPDHYVDILLPPGVVYWNSFVPITNAPIGPPDIVPEGNPSRDRLRWLLPGTVGPGGVVEFTFDVLRDLADCGPFPFEASTVVTADLPCGRGGAPCSGVESVITGPLLVDILVADPVLQGVPADEQLGCDEPLPDVVVTSTCPVTFQSSQTPGTCPAEFTETRTWTATDPSCGNTTTASQVIDVVDSPPVLLTANTQPTLTFPCEMIAEVLANPPVIQATDDCDPNVQLVQTDTWLPPAPLGCAGTLERKWTATDACGQQATFTQTVYFTDDIDPVLQFDPGLCDFPPNTYECDEPIPPPDVLLAPACLSATDNCDPDLDLSVSRVVVPSLTCPQEYMATDTWTATDDCGNSDDYSFTFTVEDTMPPTLIPPLAIAMECSSPGGVPASDLAAWFAQAQASDNCSGVTVTWAAPDPFPNGTTTVVIFTAMDDCGNTTTATSTVSIADTTPPDFLVVPGPPVLWPPFHQLINLQVSASVNDTCGGATFSLVSVSSDELDDAPGDADGFTLLDIQGAELGTPDVDLLLRAERATTGGGRTYTLEYEATDAAGNTTTVAQTVTVLLEQNGVGDPVDVRMDQAPGGTVVSWAAVPGAQSYNVIRGQLGDLVDTGTEYDLGPVTCIESGSVDTVSDSPDPAIPPSGEAFFYLVEFNDGTASTYGSDSAARPRVPGAGSCP